MLRSHFRLSVSASIALLVLAAGELGGVVEVPVSLLARVRGTNDNTRDGGFKDCSDLGGRGQYSPAQCKNLNPVPSGAACIQCIENSSPASNYVSPDNTGAKMYYSGSYTCKGSKYYGSCVSSGSGPQCILPASPNGICSGGLEIYLNQTL